jgi:flagellar basal-body rod modification protein FlgD
MAFNARINTKTWSDAKQQTNWKADNTQTVSAIDRKKVMEDGEDVGAVLNRIADPNWVDETKKIRTTGNNQLDKDAFMKLLLTQMKNQDPTNPLKSHEMAAQLAQFTSLEKLTNIDDSIKKQTDVQQPLANFESLKLIGKVVAGDSSAIQRETMDEKHPIRLNVLGDAQDVKIDIKDDTGTIVRSMVHKNVKKGRFDVDWNGITTEGLPARVGPYSVSVAATGSNGKGVGVETSFQGPVTGVTFSKAGPTLLVGNQKVMLADIKTILEGTETKTTANNSAGDVSVGAPEISKSGATPSKSGFVPIAPTKAPKVTGGPS